MKQNDVLKILELFDSSGIKVWIDGGWGVDALLGKQTREHADLDIAIRHKDVPKLRELLAARGFRQIERDGTTDYNFVLANDQGHEIDCHAFELNNDGSNALGVAYVAEHLTGKGVIAGKAVKTINPKWMVEFHTWYEPDEDDYQDVKRLCEKFNIPFPEKYKKFL